MRYNTQKRHGIMNRDWLETALQKETLLKDLLSAQGAIVVAYSGGVDSTYLADVAHETLGDRARLALADSPSIPRSELEEARALAAARGWNLVVLKTAEFDKDEFLRNDGRRCYVCKGELFEQMNVFARSEGISCIAYGETADDSADATRLGRLAAREHRALAPLQTVGLVKDEIRVLSRRRGLPTWNKASFACLASRVPKGSRIDAESLARIEQAEEALKNLGFHQYRARHHGDLCRIEVDANELARAVEPAVRETILRELRNAGYRHVTLDLAGYRTGSTAT